MNDQTAYPLCWPEGWARTASHSRSFARFATRGVSGLRHKTMEEATYYLQTELDRLGADRCVLSTNVQTRLDGMPRSGQAAPKDPGAAVYFRLKGKPTVLACDRWLRVEDNVYAIAKHIEALRGQDRWGVGSLERAFTGYAALPNVGGSSASDWYLTLGVDSEASEETVKTAYRLLASKHHPDHGGDPELFRRVQQAYEKYCQSRGLARV